MEKYIFFFNALFIVQDNQSFEGSNYTKSVAFGYWKDYLFWMKKTVIGKESRG